MKLMSQMSCKNVKDKSQSKAAATNKWQILNMQDIWFQLNVSLYIIQMKCFDFYTSHVRYLNEQMRKNLQDKKQMIVGRIQNK